MNKNIRARREEKGQVKAPSAQVSTIGTNLIGTMEPKPLRFRTSAEYK